MENFKFNLGSELKDKITGFKGICRGRTQYLTGCNHYGLQSQKLKDNKPGSWEWFDEDQLVLIENKKIELKDRNVDNGGPISKDQYPPC